MIKLAIIGTGGMAHSHARRYQEIKGVRLVAAVDVVKERAEAFAKEFEIGEVYTSVDDLLENGKFDAASVVTIDSAHAPVSIKLVEAGKHVLCEKPLATNYADAQAMADAAAKAGVINMVNLSYRNSAAIQKAHLLVAEGAVGRVLHVEASYLQSWLCSKAWGDWRESSGLLWRLSTRHGSGGVLGDIGVHILDFATFAAGDVKSLNCQLRTFHKAEGEQLGEYTLDANDSAVIRVELADGGLGVIHTTRWATGHANSLRLRVFGDLGAITIDLDSSYDVLQICRGADVDTMTWKPMDCPKTLSMYERFIKSIKTGVNDQPDFARGAKVQKMLDACFESDRSGQTITV
jgi:predicted dehydrogenase